MTKKTRQDQEPDYADSEEYPRLEARVENLEVYIPDTPNIKIVLAIPSELQIKEIVRRLPPSPHYKIKCFGNNNWYRLLERLTELQKKPFQEIKESIPPAILFPYDDSKLNAKMVNEMHLPLENSQNPSPPVKDALEVCGHISLTKGINYDAYPWLYLFSPEEIPHLTLQQNGVKKHFRTTNPEVLANALDAVAKDIFYRDLQKERRKNLRYYR